MKKFTFIMAIMILAAVSRLVPHPANFTPLTAIALASGAYLGRNILGFVIPMGILLGTDLIIGVYPGIAFNYMALALIIVLGSEVLKKKSGLRVLGSTVAGSTVFFIISNLGFWLAGNLYPKTFGGLVNCYVNAIPFYGNSLVGDLFYSVVVFGSVYLFTSSKQEVEI